MSTEEFNKMFSKKLRYYLEKYNMTQLDLSKRLGVGTTSVYNWCNAIKTPRMDKVDAMCEIFNCNRSDLIEDKETKKEVKTENLKKNNSDLDLDKIIDCYKNMSEEGKKLLVKQAEFYLKEYPDTKTNERAI